MAGACMRAGDGSGETLRQADVIGDVLTSIRPSCIYATIPPTLSVPMPPTPAQGSPWKRLVTALPFFLLITGSAPW